MRVIVSALLTIMAVSLWKFTVSSVGYVTHHPRTLRYKRKAVSIPLLEPRLSFEYEVFETPPMVVEIINTVIETEKQKPDIENKEPGIDEIDGSSNL
jgi:hypothetical protein